MKLRFNEDNLQTLITIRYYARAYYIAEYVNGVFQGDKKRKILFTQQELDKYFFELNFLLNCNKKGGIKFKKIIAECKEKLRFGPEHVLAYLDRILLKDICFLDLRRPQYAVYRKINDPEQSFALLDSYYAEEIILNYNWGTQFIPSIFLNVGTEKALGILERLKRSNKDDKL